ncbi:hypothetical protein ACFL4T_05055 [candidate division KSB1 bacterium]
MVKIFLAKYAKGAESAKKKKAKAEEKEKTCIKTQKKVKRQN